MAATLRRPVEKLERSPTTRHYEQRQPNGDVLIAGGYDNAFLNGVELYTP
jgi:hypothetical protein